MDDKKRILVVQSNEELRYEICSGLRSEETSVICPGTFEGTLNAIDFYSFDIVVLDPLLWDIPDWSALGNENVFHLLDKISQSAIEHKRKVTIVPIREDNYIAKAFKLLKSDYCELTETFEIITEGNVHKLKQTLQPHENIDR